jgi:serine/threonine protein kinase
MIEAGTVLQNRYRIDKKIGQGGMGAVFVATDERFGSIVAIKETFFTDEGFRKAFEREARLLNNLRHPALPRVSDHFGEENGQFLVMEYIAGDDLSEKLEETDSPFPIEDVLNWADQLLDALDFLHTQESPVIHRDIKPQNLKLTPRGQIILLDFGLAKGNPTDAKHQTNAQSVFGYSRNYASLEQIQGTGTDPRSDLYSLGATLYHLMTGIPPVDALTRAMTVLNGDADPLLSADDVHKQVSAGVSEVLSRAMALNANHRPTSAVAMRAMLEESDKSVNGYKTASTKKSAANLLLQNTEVFDNTVKSRNTEQANLETEIMPLAVSVNDILSNKTQNESSKISLSDDSESSILTKVDTVIKDNQKAVSKDAATVVQPQTVITQSKPANRGKAIGATILGGLLLIGSAAGALYIFKPNVPQPINNIADTTIEKQDDSEKRQNNPADVNLANTNASSDNSGKTQTIVTKKDDTQKFGDKTTTVNNTAPGKNNTKNSDNGEVSAGKRSKAETVEIKDENGDTIKMSENRIETKDVIVENGRVTMKNDNRGTPQTPPIPDNLKNLPPAQRRKIKNMIKKHNQMQQQQNPPPEQP